MDVVIPFAGDQAQLRSLLARLEHFVLENEDSLTVVDNTGGRTQPLDAGEGIRVVEATQIASSYYARNAGARLGSGEWIVFLDADVSAPADLLSHYFDPPPSSGTGVLVGGIRDEPATETMTAVSRFLALKASMAQDNTWASADHPYAQTANCAVRRSAFDAIDGFRSDVRSGGDADLCFRLRDAGWGFEERPAALVVHQNRTALKQLVRQRARHGAGAAWLNEEYPGTFPPARLPGLLKWSVKSVVAAIREMLGGNPDSALVHWLDPVSTWAFELGRRLPNRASRSRAPTS